MFSFLRFTSTRMIWMSVVTLDHHHSRFTIKIAVQWKLFDQLQESYPTIRCVGDLYLVWIFFTVFCQLQHVPVGCKKPLYSRTVTIFPYQYKPIYRADHCTGLVLVQNVMDLQKCCLSNKQASVKVSIHEKNMGSSAISRDISDSRCIS